MFQPFLNHHHINHIIQSSLKLHQSVFNCHAVDRSVADFLPALSNTGSIPLAKIVLNLLCVRALTFKTQHSADSAVLTMWDAIFHLPGVQQKP